MNFITRFKFHILHNRSSAGTLRYLPVSIAKGRIPLLNWQKIDRLNFGINKLTYNSVLRFILNRAYARNLGLDATLSFHWWVSFLTRCSLTFRNGICEMSYTVLSTMVDHWTHLTLEAIYSWIWPVWGQYLGRIVPFSGCLILAGVSLLATAPVPTGKSTTKK